VSLFLAETLAGKTDQAWEKPVDLVFVCYLEEPVIISYELNVKKEL
jgi:hypothetical protein